MTDASKKIDFSQDKDFINIKNQLEDYADAVKYRQIRRGKEKKAYGKDYDSAIPYPYTEDVAHNFREKIKSFLTRTDFSEDDAKRANGNLLWLYSEYIGTPFEQHALALIDMSVDYPIADADKINFLNYVLTAPKTENKKYKKDALFYKLTPRQMAWLADFDMSSEYEQYRGAEIIDKVNKQLQVKIKKPEKILTRVKNLHAVLSIYAKNVQESDADLLDMYTKMWFAMADSLPNRNIDTSMLGYLLTKTKGLKDRKVFQNTLFADEKSEKQKAETFKKKVDYIALQRLVAAYVEHLCEYEDGKKLHITLYDGMSRLLGSIGKYYPLEPKKAEKIAASLNVKNSYFISMAVERQKRSFVKSCRDRLPVLRKRKPRDIVD